MAQELADAIVSASQEMVNENSRAFATLEIRTVCISHRLYFVDIPEFDREHWPACPVSRTPLPSLASALNSLAYAGFYPTNQQMNRIQEFWDQPLTLDGKLSLIFCRKIPSCAVRPEN